MSGGVRPLRFALYLPPKDPGELRDVSPTPDFAPVNLIPNFTYPRTLLRVTQSLFEKIG